jgi:hypothetical protein
MCPPVISAEVRSGAERRLFDQLRDGLPNTWTVLHSLGVMGHRTKAWAEIDFVLIGPSGVYCLEVKGGRVSRQDGVWTFTDRFGRQNTKREGPFEQVGTASAVLRRTLAERFPWAREVAVGFGVAMPDIRFEASGVDMDKEIVYDATDMERPIKTYLERLEGHWRRRITEQRGRSPSELTPQQLVLCVDAIRPDFDLRVSLRAAIGVAKNELLRLTEEQFRVLDGLIDNPRMIVRGGAGTGKTLLAVEEAKRAAAQGSRVLYCCFNKGLAEYVRRVLSGAPQIVVETIHGFMGTTVRRAGMEGRIQSGPAGDLYETTLPNLATEALLNFDGPPFDVLICDEGQDVLRPAYLDVFDCALSGGLRSGTWRLFLDPLQDIFEASDQSQVQRLRELGAAQYRLTVNCRNTEPIAVGTGLLAGMAATEVMKVAGPEVEYVWYESDPQLRKSLANSINRVLSERVDSRDMVILSPRRFDRSAIHDGLERLGARVVNDTVPRPGELRFMTIHSFKGLESDVVFLVDIDDLEGPAARSAVYVGASRARAILSVFLSNSCKPSFLSHAEDYGATIAKVQPSTDG